MKYGFDNDKYISIQSMHIQERIAERMHEPDLDGIHCAHLVEDVYVSDAEVDKDEEDHDQRRG